MTTCFLQASQMHTFKLLLMAASQGCITLMEECTVWSLLLTWDYKCPQAQCSCLLTSYFKWSLFVMLGFVLFCFHFHFFPFILKPDLSYFVPIVSLMRHFCMQYVIFYLLYFAKHDGLNSLCVQVLRVIFCNNIY